MQAAIIPPATLVAPLPSAEFESKNTLIRASYKNFMPRVNNFLDCGLKIQGLLIQLRNDLHGRYTVNELGLTVRIVRGKGEKTIALQGGWSGTYHVYMRSEDDKGNNYLYDPYIGADNCRGTTSETLALPELWKTKMDQMEFISVAGVGTDIPVSEYMANYNGKWEPLVDHAKARASDPKSAGEFTDWY